MSILIITDPDADGHLYPVLKELRRRGSEVYLFNPGAYPLSATISVDSMPSGLRAAISWAGQEIDLDQVGSVWYRRPGEFEFPEELSPKEVEWVRGESSALLNGIYANTDALWVSMPHSIRRASLKLLQLRLAQQFGLRVPASIVTNDPEQARSFLAAHPEGVVVKGLWKPMVILEDRASMIYTHLVTPEDVDLLDSVRYGPTFFQARIPKRRDIRVTVIGEQLFAAGIDSMTEVDARIDFRRAEIFDLPHEPLDLPEAVAAACLSIVRELDLMFGAIDLVETPEGDYVFLENNPNGQWYWIEMMTGMPMTVAMADLLERGARGQRSRPTPCPAGTPRTVPIGEQVVPIVRSLATELASTQSGELPRLVASRSWMEQRNGHLLVHIGDIEQAAPDESR